MASETRKRNAGEHLRRVVDQFRTQLTMPAVGAGLVINGELVLSYVVGVRKHGTNHQTQPDDLFNLGSITKPMTGYLIARLISQGHLDWTSTIGDVHKDIIDKLREKLGPQNKTWVDHYRDRTVTDLMTHTSGIAELEEDPNAQLFLIHPDPRKKQIEKRKHFTKLNLEQTPYLLSNGARQNYAQGCVIVTSMVEKLLGTEFEDLMVKHVFEPLGITHYAFGPMSREEILTNTVLHQFQNGKIKSIVFPNVDKHSAWVSSPAGAVGLSVKDFAKWIAAIMTNPNSLLSQSVWDDYVGARPNDGFTRGGWFGGSGRLTHNGSNFWNYALATIDLNKDLGMFACTNIGSTATDNAVTNICNELEGIGNSWEAFDYLHQAVEPTLVTASADSVLNSMADAPFVSDGLFRTLWASSILTPTLTAQLDKPRMLKGVIICQGIAPRIDTLEFKIESGDSGATPQILSGTALDNQTVRSANGFVIRTLFHAPVKTKTLKITMTSIGTMPPRICRLLLLEYDWTVALDFDIDAGGHPWVVNASHRVMSTVDTVDESTVVFRQIVKGCPPNHMARKALNFVYVLGDDNKVWRGKPGDWKQIPDTVASIRIAVDAKTDTVWSIDVQKRVRRYDGTSWVEYPGNGRAEDLYVRNGKPYIISTDGSVYRGIANGWQKLPGSPPTLRRVTVDESAKHWAIDKDNRILSYDAATDAWVEHPGGGKGWAIAVYKGIPYVIGMNNGIWKSNGNKWTRLTVLQDKDL